MLADIQVFPISSRETLVEAQDAAKENGRVLMFPSHVIFKKGEIIGAFCTRSPTVYWWTHSEKVTRSDSKYIFNSLETLMNEGNSPTYILPCHLESPYYSILNKRLTKYEGDHHDHWSLFIRE